MSSCPPTAGSIVHDVPVSQQHVERQSHPTWRLLFHKPSKLDGLVSTVLFISCCDTMGLPNREYLADLNVPGLANETPS